MGVLTKIARFLVLDDPYGIAKNVEVLEDNCAVCGSEGDFFQENDQLIKKENAGLRTEAVALMVQDLSNQGISFSSAERALGLPQRTFSKWKNGSIAPSAGAAALVRFIHLFPWLLSVADSKFEVNAAMKIHAAAAMGELCDKAKAGEVEQQ